MYIDILFLSTLSLYLVITTCISAIILFIPLVYHYFIKSTKIHNESIRYDQERDLKIPFSDAHRVSRLIFGTLILFFISIYSLYDQVRIFNNNNHNEDLIQNIIAAAIVLTSWLYVLILTFISKKLQLPNQRGFIINIHLCIIYAVGFIISIYNTWILVTTQSNMTWLNSLPIILSLFFTGDLVYTTITASKGAPFIDLEGRSVNSFNVASIWSLLIFGWVTPLVRLAYKKKDLTDDDLPALTLHFRSFYLFHLIGECRHSKLLNRLFHVNRLILISQVFLTIIMALLRFVPLYFINWILNLIQEVSTGKKDDNFIENSILIVTGLGFSMFAYITVMNIVYFLSSTSILIRNKSMLNIEIYRKTLHHIDINSNNENNKNKKNGGQNEHLSFSNGAIVNLMGTDIARISLFCANWFFLLSIPVETFIGIFFLYKLIGVSCFFGLLILIITLFLNHFNAKLYSKSQEHLMETRDKRVNLMSEVLQGIRQVKFFAWEKKWKERIMEVRKLELKHLRTIYLYQLGINFLWQGAPILVTVVSFCAFTKLEGKDLTASIAFTSIAVFNELKVSLSMLPDVIVLFFQALVSARRIEKYLNENEVTSPPSVNINKLVIGFKNAAVGYKLQNKPTMLASSLPSSSSPLSPSSLPLSSLFDSTAKTLITSNINEEENNSDGFVLKNLNLEFPNDDLSIICGKTGSGKSLMMLSLLGEAFVLEGQVSCPRSSIADSVSEDYKLIEEYIAEENWILNHAVAYVAQTAWLQNASIRDNILFGLPYNEKRYKDTLYVCSLIKDLSIFEDGDQTEIGEKGITLSGGQKARVSLARAVYSRAKIIFMDDVLSAVDAHTAQHIYENCLMGPLMKHRTRILITHHVKLCISGASYLVHIQDGYAHISGSIDDLKNNGKLETILGEDGEHRLKCDQSGIKDDINSENKNEIKNQEIIEFEKIEVINNSNDLNNNDNADDSTGKNYNNEKKVPKILVETEKRETGSVKLRLYYIYFKMFGNPLYWFIAIIVFIGSRGIDVTESWWIKQWTQSYNSSNIMDAKSKEDKLNYYLGFYIAIAASNIFISVSRVGVIYFGALCASKKVYAGLLFRILRAPLRFFDTTPVGRILNRFSSDFETIDSTLPNELLRLITHFTVLISGIIAVSSALPYFLLPMVLVIIINAFVAIMYSSSSRELRRMDSISRSPLFTHFTETVTGISTIRAFGATHRFLQEMVKRIDTNSRPSYFVWVINRWVCVRYGYSSAFMDVITCIIILLNIDHMDASLAGFCLSYVLMQNTDTLWLIRKYTELEMSFNSIERVVEYMEIDQEADAITEYKPPPQWPTHGAIQVSNLQIRYADHLPPVLHDLSFTVKPQEKIGIVGTTGSGKSTLALSFFRFIEASKGSIVIDNVDISRIGTEDLRSNLTIIPQDPVLFSGTLRSNLDPFDKFTDEIIFNTFRRLQLTSSNDDDDNYNETEKNDNSNDNEITDINENVFKNLNTIVNEGGKNFSNGQRQLICLARALLKRSKVVIMDEATASVDFDTDRLIQKHITTEFSDSTILTIAHRLATVINYDRIMVLHHGNLLEFDSPMNLLKNPGSAFYKMCEKSGEFDSLYATAFEKK
ncbi:unnamed protein product [Cunninghamella blakesleeana]